jgi:DNA-binding HxlR family transcriptional regulator
MLDTVREPAVPASTFSPFYDICPSRQLLELIADKWTVLVIRAIADGYTRSSLLRRRIAGLSQRMLTRTLRDLERDGFVERIDLSQRNLHVEYHLTPLATTLVPICDVMTEWTIRHVPQVEAARRAFDARASALNR